MYTYSFASGERRKYESRWPMGGNISLVLAIYFYPRCILLYLGDIGYPTIQDRQHITIHWCTRQVIC